MKRFMLILAVVLCLAASAQAEGAERRTGMAMCIADCEEYVTLREAPDGSADGMTRIPLHDTVVFLEEAENGFCLVGYDGMTGFVREEYLEDVLELMYPRYDADAQWGVTVTAEYGYEGSAEGERAVFRAVSTMGTEIWSFSTSTDYVTELDLLDGFLAGTFDAPMYMVYNAQKGLTAIDLLSGSVLWQLPGDEPELGGSISHAVGPDGTMYIGGYYGPDPVAISKDGEILWHASSGNDELYWLYRLELTDEGILAWYDSMPEEPVLYGYDGTVIG